MVLRRFLLSSDELQDAVLLIVMGAALSRCNASSRV